MTGLQLADIALFLNRLTEAKELQYLQRLSEKGRFTISVFGHYSAGKSKLLNTLLDRAILPVKATETTAVLTYLQYSQQEYAQIFYTSGVIERCDLSVLAQVYQDNQTISVDAVDHIEVYLNHSLLEGGLVLVDTPGVNTIIGKHTALAAEGLMESHKIIYVLGGAMSNVDKQYLQEMQRCGIAPIVVRTKCDLIRAEEETVDAVLTQEREALQRVLGGLVELIGVSSQVGTQQYFQIDVLRQQLICLRDDSASEIRQSCQKRFDVYVADYTTLLREKTALLEQLCNDDTAGLNEKIAEHQQTIASIENRMKTQAKRVEQHLKENLAPVKRQAEILGEGTAEQLRVALERLPIDERFNESAQECWQQEIANAIQSCTQMVKSDLDTLFDPTVEQPLLDSAQLPVLSYDELVLEVSRSMVYKREGLQALKQQIQALRALPEAERTFSETDYDACMAEIQDQLDAITSDVAMVLSDQQPMQPSKVFKGIGQAVDMALLLIPGEQIIAGLGAMVNVTKVAQQLNSAGKVGQAVVKGAQSLAATANVVDTTRDVATTLNAISKRRAYSTQADKAKAAELVSGVTDLATQQYQQLKAVQTSESPLDWLNVSHWTEKFGKQFDKTPRFEVNRAVEEAKRQRRQELQEQYQCVLDAKVDQLRQAHAFDSQQKEQAYRKQQAEQEAKNMERQLVQETDALVATAKKQAMVACIGQYVQKVQSELVPHLEKLVDAYFQNAKANIPAYIEERGRELLAQQHMAQAELEALCADETATERHEQLACCQGYLNQLLTEGVA